MSASVAMEKLGAAGGKLVLGEMAAVEITDRFPPEGFDAVAPTLVLSEMSEDEQDYVLRAAWRLLRAGGPLVAADEVRQQG